MRGERETEIDLTRKKVLGNPELGVAPVLEVADGGESLGLQEVLRDVVWGGA
jgi:hypothetical protein